jgi:hypothetical protein
MADIAKSWIFASSSGSNTYETLQYTDGSTSCNCRGWTFKRDGKERQCKHTRMVEHGIADRNCVSVIDKQARTERNPSVKVQAPAKTVAETAPVMEKVRTRKIVW